MGRAADARREHRSRRLTAPLRPPAGPASSLSSLGFAARLARLAACLLAAALFLLPGAETAEAETYRIECSTSNFGGGYWHVATLGYGDRRIACDMNRPAWNFGAGGGIRWIYDGTPGFHDQGNLPPPVDQAVESVTWVVPGDEDHRAVRGTDGQCYREERGERGWPRGWHRSRSYGSLDGDCRNAAWNAYYRSRGLNMVDPAGGTFPTGALPTVPLFESASAYRTTLELTFDQKLSTASRTAPGAFHVTVNNARRNVAARGVNIRGRTVTLTLESAVAGGDTVRVRYTRPSANPLRGANHLVVDSFGDVTVTDVKDAEGPPGNFWAAMLTVGQANPQVAAYGCFIGSSQSSCSSALTEDSFTRGGTPYQVRRVTIQATTSSGYVLAFILDNAIPSDWTLHVGDRKFAFADATLSVGNTVAGWNFSGISWSVGQKVSLWLTASGATGNTGGATGNQGPSPKGLSVFGRQLKVTFSEPLDEGAPPRGDSFTVKMTPDGGSGARMQMATRGGPGRTVSGTGTASVSGTTVTVTLDTAVPPGWKVTVSYARPEANALRARSGAPAAAFSEEPASNDAADGAGPSFRSATVTGNELRVRFDKALDEDAAPPGSSFTVQMRPRPDAGGGATGGRPSTGTSFGGIPWSTLIGGGTSGTGAPRSVAGTGTVSVSGAAVTVTLPESIAPGEPVTVSYVPPDANALRGRAGTRAAAFSLQRATVVAPETASEPPGAPTGVTVSGASATELSVSWTAPADTGSAAVAGYELRWYAGASDPSDASAWTETGDVGAGTSATVADLAADTAYRVQVRARGDGNGPWSASGAGRTEAAGAVGQSGGKEPPGAPTGVTVSGASATSLSVSWTAPADTGSAAVAGYELRWYAGASDPSDASAWTETGDVGAGTSATVAGLAAGTGYRVQVRARGDGNGPWSASGAGRTEAVPLTASFVGMPAEHDGATPFAFELRFSEDFRGLSYKVLRAAVWVRNGRVTRAKRVEKGQNQRWTITVKPSSIAAVVVRLPAAVNCSQAWEVCTKEGRKLSNTVTARVLGPTLVSVAGARAREGVDLEAVFPVMLSRAAPGAVTVDYATADGTATAGEDYTAASGTLTFAAGEWMKEVRVAVLDDALDEGRETFLLRLSNVSGAQLGNGEATGTITNDDPLQKMWLSRFGRTVAGHVTDAVSDRLANPLTGAQVTVGGQSVDLAQAGDGAALTQALTGLARALGATGGPPAGDGPDGVASGPWPGTGPGSSSGTGLGLRGAPADAGTPGRVPEGRELLLGSAFHLATDGERSGPGLTAWGRVTLGGFDGEAPADGGDVRIDGNVTTGILGADAAWRRLLAGVAVSVSEGEGRFAQPGVDSGTVESTMTTVSPYARFMVNDRLSVWGLAGWGTGDMTIVQDARAAADGQPERPERISRTDLEMRLAALGGRGALMQADETGGIDLGLRADAFWVETESEPISNEGRTTANASRVRLALEGSRAFRVGGGTLTPGLELGLRHDGGDAETGTGVELGGRIAYEDPETGLGVEARARTLVAHEDSDYREWGASGSVRLAPGERGRGLSFSLSPTWGAASSGVDRLWRARDARGLAPNGEFEAGQRLEGELGYGLGLFGDRFTGTPNVGFGLSDGARDYTIGWRLNSVVRGDPGFEVNLDATRREAANDDAPAEHGVMLRGAIRW